MLKKTKVLKSNTNFFIILTIALQIYENKTKEPKLGF